MCNLAQPIIIIGDFNVNVFSPGAETFLHYMQQTYNMQQYIMEPTTHEGTAIDLVFSNIPHVIAFPVMNSWSTHHTLMAYVPSNQPAD